MHHKATHPSNNVNTSGRRAATSFLEHSTIEVVVGQLSWVLRIARKAVSIFLQQMGEENPILYTMISFIHRPPPSHLSYPSLGV